MRGYRFAVINQSDLETTESVEFLRRPQKSMSDRHCGNRTNRKIELTSCEMRWYRHRSKASKTLRSIIVFFSMPELRYCRTLAKFKKRSISNTKECQTWIKAVMKKFLDSAQRKNNSPAHMLARQRIRRKSRRRIKSPMLSAIRKWFNLSQSKFWTVTKQALESHQYLVEV